MNWMRSFSDKELHAPFVVDKDGDYYSDLRKRLTHFVKILQLSADEESYQIGKKYSDKVCEAVRCYYKGKVTSCYQIIENLVKKCNDHKLAVSVLKESKAFPGNIHSEIQFYRARVSSNYQQFGLKDMLHPPFRLRGNSGNYRFSIPGITCLYLANSSYGCWLEADKPSEHDFYVSPVLLEGNQKIFNLAVMTRDCSGLNDGEIDYVHCWIKLLVLMIASSYIVREEGRTFRSEYIVSQSIMLACKKIGYDGVAYFSKKVESELLAFNAINLSLFAEYDPKKDYGDICYHIKVDDPLNYQLFRQLNQNTINMEYKLRIDDSMRTSNINGFKRQYNYKATAFYQFDIHLYARWEEKDSISWGNALLP